MELGERDHSMWLPSMDEVGPGAVKNSLPLDWFLETYWGLHNPGSAKIECPNPEHEDSTPSFNLWMPNGQGWFLKYGCYGCGLRGDVIDAIQLHFGLSYSDAIDKAIDELIPEYQNSGYTPAITSETKVFERDEIQTAYDQLRASSPNNYQVLTKFLLTTEIFVEGMLEYVIEEWRWQGHQSIHSVSQPLYSPDDILFGVKYRDCTNRLGKWGIKGSKLVHLYGAWRDQGHRNVVLCEGETDTVNAALQLRGRECDVFGIPSGAAQLPTKEALDQLSGRQVWIIFDGDTQGQDAADMWCSRLAGGHIVEVPYDRDLTNCGLTVKELLGLKEK